MAGFFRRRSRLIVGLLVLLVAGAAGGWISYRHFINSHLQAANKELARFHYESAWQQARKAAKWEWPKNGETEFVAARLARRAGDLPEAKTHLAAAEQRLGETDEIRLEKRLLDVQSGEASTFLESTMQERMELEPEHRTLILEALIRGAFVSTRLYRIKQLTDEWLKEPTPDPRPYYWRGFAHERFGGYQQDRAIEDYKSALERDGDFDDARERLANLLLNKNWTNEARPQFEILLQRRPDDPKIMAGMGRCLTAAGEIEQSRQFLDGALTRFPNDPDLLRERGILALHDGKPEEAEPYLRHAVESKTQDLAAGYNLYLCLQRLGREKEAKEQYDRHKALEAETNRLRRLLREYQDRPRDPDLLYEIGSMYLATGNAEFEVTGLDWLRRALEINPHHKKTCILLADFYERKGMKELAARLRDLAGR